MAPPTLLIDSLKRLKDSESRWKCDKNLQPSEVRREEDMSP